MVTRRDFLRTAGAAGITVVLPGMAWAGEQAAQDNLEQIKLDLQNELNTVATGAFTGTRAGVDETSEKLIATWKNWTATLVKTGLIKESQVPDPAVLLVPLSVPDLPRTPKHSLVAIAIDVNNKNVAAYPDVSMVKGGMEKGEIVLSGEIGTKEQPMPAYIFHTPQTVTGIHGDQIPLNPFASQTVFLRSIEAINAENARRDKERKKGGHERY